MFAVHVSLNSALDPYENPNSVRIFCTVFTQFSSHVTLARHVYGNCAAGQLEEIAQIDLHKIVVLQIKQGILFTHISKRLKFKI